MQATGRYGDLVTKINQSEKELEKLEADKALQEERIRDLEEKLGIERAKLTRVQDTIQRTITQRDVDENDSLLIKNKKTTVVVDFKWKKWTFEANGPLTTEKQVKKIVKDTQPYKLLEEFFGVTDISAKVSDIRIDAGSLGGVLTRTIVDRFAVPETINGLRDFKENTYQYDTVTYSISPEVFSWYIIPLSYNNANVGGIKISTDDWKDILTPRTGAIGVPDEYMTKNKSYNLADIVTEDGVIEVEPKPVYPIELEYANGKRIQLNKTTPYVSEQLDGQRVHNLVRSLNWDLNNLNGTPIGFKKTQEVVSGVLVFFLEDGKYSKLIEPAKGGYVYTPWVELVYYVDGKQQTRIPNIRLLPGFSGHDFVKLIETDTQYSNTRVRNEPEGIRWAKGDVSVRPTPQDKNVTYRLYGTKEHRVIVEFEGHQRAEWIPENFTLKDLIRRLETPHRNLFASVSGPGKLAPTILRKEDDKVFIAGAPTILVRHIAPPVVVQSTSRYPNLRPLDNMILKDHFGDDQDAETVYMNELMARHRDRDIITGVPKGDPLWPMISLEIEGLQ